MAYIFKNLSGRTITLNVGDAVSFEYFKLPLYVDNATSGQRVFGIVQSITKSLFSGYQIEIKGEKNIPDLNDIIFHIYNPSSLISGNGPCTKSYELKVLNHCMTIDNFNETAIVGKEAYIKHYQLVPENLAGGSIQKSIKPLLFDDKNSINKSKKVPPKNLATEKVPKKKVPPKKSPADKVPKKKVPPKKSPTEKVPKKKVPPKKSL